METKTKAKEKKSVNTWEYKDRNYYLKGIIQNIN